MVESDGEIEIERDIERWEEREMWTVMNFSGSAIDGEKGDEATIDTVELR